MRTATKAFPTRIILTGIGILCLALVFNTCRLAAVPPGLDRDAAANGLMALKWLREGVFPFWMSHASAPEPLIVWLQTLSTAIFGPSFFALRIVSAVAISFSAVVVYVLSFEVARWMNADARYYAALFAGLASAANSVMSELGRNGLRAAFNDTIALQRVILLFRESQLSVRVLLLAVEQPKFGYTFFVHLSTPPEIRWPSPRCIRSTTPVRLASGTQENPSLQRPACP